MSDSLSLFLCPQCLAKTDTLLFVEGEHGKVCESCFSNYSRCRMCGKAYLKQFVSEGICASCAGNDSRIVDSNQQGGTYDGTRGKTEGRSQEMPRQAFIEK